LSALLFAAASFALTDMGQLATQMPTSSELSELSQVAATDSMTAEVMTGLQSINYIELIVVFFIFFFGGYLIYSALFAAVGSAVDSETEANQFTFPLTMPLLL